MSKQEEFESHFFYCKAKLLDSLYNTIYQCTTTDRTVSFLSREGVRSGYDCRADINKSLHQIKLCERIRKESKSAKKQNHEIS